MRNKSVVLLKMVQRDQCYCKQTYDIILISYCCWSTIAIYIKQMINAALAHYRDPFFINPVS